MTEVGDFLDCTKLSLTVLGGGMPSWPEWDWIFPKATYAPDEAGTVTIKTKLPSGDASLPISVKNGKLHIETRAVKGKAPYFPKGTTTQYPPLKGKKVIEDKASEIEQYVEFLNHWFNEKGHNFASVTVKDGNLVLTKAALPAPGKAAKPDDTPGGKGIKGGPFPNLPTWGKVGAAGLLGLSIVFGVGFMNAGDGTETRSETVCPEPGGPGESQGAGVDCPPVGEMPPVGGAGDVTDITEVSIRVEGRDPAPGVVEPGNEPGEIFFDELAIFEVGEPHRVALRDVQGDLVDRFTLTVPAESGVAPEITSEAGARVRCLVDHENPTPPGDSGADCQYVGEVGEPAVPPPPDDAGDDGTIEPVRQEVEETTDAKPWSLLGPLGTFMLVLGGLNAWAAYKILSGDENWSFKQTWSLLVHGELVDDTEEPESQLEQPDLKPGQPEVFPNPNNPPPKLDPDQVK